MSKLRSSSRPIGLAALVAAIMLALAAPMAPAQAAGGGATQKKVSGSDAYLKMKPITATIAQNGFPRAVLHVEAGLEVKDGAARRRVRAAMPRVRAACGEALRTYVGAHYRYGMKPDGDQIAADMQRAVNHALRDEGATVLLSLLVVHGR